MNVKQLIPAALLALVAATSSVSAFAGTLTDEPQAESTLTREQVKADTLAALKRGDLRHTAYDEQESVTVARDHQLSGAPVSSKSRSQVREETRAFFKAHPESTYEAETYGIAG